MTQPRPGERSHCPHGHPYDHDNTYVDPKGSRRCRECYRRRHRAWKAAAKLERARENGRVKSS